MRLRNFKQTSLGISIGAALLLVACSPFATITLIKQQASQIVNDTLVGLTSSGNLQINVSEGFVEALLALSTTNRTERGTLVQQILKMSQETDASLRAYKGSIKDGVDRRNFEVLNERCTQFRHTRREVLQLLDEGKTPEAKALYDTRLLSEFQAYLKAVDELIQYNVREAKQRGDRIIGLCDTLQGIQILLLAFFIIYAFCVPLIAVLERLGRRSEITDF